MYELSKAGEKSDYINCPAKIGIYTAGDNEVYLIDSGNDKDAGRRVKKILGRKPLASEGDFEYTFQRRSYWRESLPAVPDKL